MEEASELHWKLIYASRTQASTSLAFACKGVRNSFCSRWSETTVGRTTTWRNALINFRNTRLRNAFKHGQVSVYVCMQVSVYIYKYVWYVCSYALSLRAAKEFVLFLWGGSVDHSVSSVKIEATNRMRVKQISDKHKSKSQLDEAINSKLFMNTLRFDKYQFSLPCAGFF